MPEKVFGIGESLVRLGVSIDIKTRNRMEFREILAPVVVVDGHFELPEITGETHLSGAWNFLVPEQ